MSPYFPKSLVFFFKGKGCKTSHQEVIPDEHPGKHAIGLDENENSANDICAHRCPVPVQKMVKPLREHQRPRPAHVSLSFDFLLFFFEGKSCKCITSGSYS